MSINETPTKWKHKLLMGSLAIVAVALIILGILVLVHPGEVLTNDAQIDGHIHPINTRIAGTVTWVNAAVEDTRFVKAGTVLAHLDRNDYQPVVDRLEGDLEAAEAQRLTAALNISITSTVAISRLSSARAAVADAEADLKSALSQQAAAEATIKQAEANYHRAENDRVRYAALVATHEISRSEYDQRATDSKTADAILLAAQANDQSADQRIESARQKIAERQSDVQSSQTAPEAIASARANLERALGETKKSRASLWNARLDLGYTNLIAPVTGIVGRKSMEVGQRVTAGQLMLTLVPPNEVWAIANFRETQLHHMRVGQSAKIHVDSYDRDLVGVVESIGGATGSKYSVIAPENATGNYVKVVQRVPVRIRIDSSVSEKRLLVPGMSIEVTVRVKD